MPLLTYSILIITTFFWGGTFIAGRMLAGEVTPPNAAFLRFAIATFSLFFLTLFIDGKISIPKRTIWIRLFALGLTGVFTYNVFFFSGLQHISAGRASLIIALNPLCITLFAYLIFKEPLNRKQMAGIFLSLLGAIIVISNGHVEELFSSEIGVGELSLLGCVLSWTAYSLIGRSVLSTLTPLASVFYSSIIGTCLLFIPAVSDGIFSHLSEISVTNWISLSYLGICGTALGFSLYYQAIRKIGATRSGVFINLVPLFSILLSWIILGETIKLIVVFGGCILLTGVTVTNLNRDEGDKSSDE